VTTPVGFGVVTLGHLREVKIPIALLAVTALVAGCGGSDEPTDPPETQATETPSQAAPTPMATIDAEGDKATVKAVQLTLEDLPSGWQGEASSGEGRSNCPAVREARETATARGDSPQFSPSETTIAESAAYLYTDDGAATKAFGLVSSAKTLQCLADELVQRVGDPGNGVEIGEPAVEQVQAEPAGDEGAARRITIPLSGDDGSEATAIADLEFARIGRGLVLMTYGNLTEPLDGALRAQLTRTVAERLTTELGR